MRKKYVDMLKGISILSIMLLHFECGLFSESLNVWIGGFMVNSFFFVSGWLQGDRPIELDRAYWSRRWRTLGIPYLCFSTLILVFDLLMAAAGELPLSILCRDMYKTLVLRGIGTLWFIPALWIGEVLFALFRKLRVVGKISIVFLTLLILQGYTSWKLRFAYNDNILHKAIDAPFNALSCCCWAWLIIAGGFYIARLCGDSIHNSSVSEKIVSAILLLSWYTLCVVWGFNGNFSWMAGIVSSLGLLIVCMLLEPLESMVFFSFLGRNSLILMATHFSIVLEICKIVNRYWFGGNELYGWPSIGFFVITLLVELPIVWFFNHCCPFFVGKKRRV